MNRELPPAREFLTSAGFAGAGALLAALIVAAVAMFALRRASQRHQSAVAHREQRRDDELHAAAVARCWQRLVWLVETAGLEPAASENATLGLGPELALELLRGLLRDAERLGDDTLAKAVSVYLSQFSLVLAQQGSLLSELVTASAAGTNGQDEHADTDEPDGAPAPAAQEPVAPTSVATGGRRRS